ncbi:MAG TPA: prepilin-type N-terminal cleavage/methylation domain-containing protein [Longimicrobiales bacterium]|nr:prepilin-type N-terminal cleavage/methylation domain-containing protein [Longimicrobiales bacterium]
MNAMKNRDGVTLVELLVAMVLLAVMLTSVAGLTFEAARRSIVTTGDSYRQAAMLEEVNRLTAEPYGNLSPGSECRTVSSGVFPHTRCVTTAGTGLYSVQLTVVVSPTQRGVLPDTVVFTRARAPLTNPLAL